MEEIRAVETEIEIGKKLIESEEGKASIKTSLAKVSQSFDETLAKVGSAVTEEVEL